MKLKEYEGLRLFKKYKIPTPNYTLLKKGKRIPRIKKDVLIKAQVLVGKRKKGGGVIRATSENVVQVVENMFEKSIYDHFVNEVLLEELLQVDQEFYVGLIIDGFRRDIKCLVSEQGGIDIEELSKSNPEKIISFPYEKKTLLKNLSSFKKRKELVSIINKLHDVMISYDADLVEINPLILSKGKLIAADSKITIDDNALYRQKEFNQKKKEELTPIEEKAFEYGLQYVDLDGDISVIGDGAGLVMATLDILYHFGGRAADFLDVGGGASIEKMEQALEILSMKKSKGIFINIFGGITRCDEIAQGIIHYMQTHQLNIPLVVRMTGTNDKEAIELLNKNGIHSYDNMEHCAKKIISLAKKFKIN